MVYFFFFFLNTHPERDLFKRFGSRDYGGWQIPNLQVELSGWLPREKLVLWFKSEGCLLQNFLLRGGQFFVLFGPSPD